MTKVKVTRLFNAVTENQPCLEREGLQATTCTGPGHTVTTAVQAAQLLKQAVGGRPPRYASAPCKLTISSYLFARWHLFRHVG